MKALPTVAWVLGYGGLIPFFVLAVLVLLGNEFLPQDITTSQLALWLAAYAALILSFLGAVHWGVVLGMQDKLSDAETRTLLIYSVTPSLFAWFSLILPINTALLSMALLIVAAYLADRLLLLPKLNSNYAVLRLRLTIIVSLLLVAVSVGQIV